MTTVGVVIPTLDEGANLPDLLADLRRVALSLQVVVADGGSRDDTVMIARSAGADVVSVPRGRAAQMNAGAAACSTEWLCFLHADVRLPDTARHQLEQTVMDPRSDAAVWRLAIEADGWWFRVLERGALVRDRVGGLPYGDQGILVRRKLFERLGGDPDLPRMEDVAFLRALRRHARLTRLSAPVVVSARRWTAEGPLRAFLRNTFLLGAYMAGVSPHRLVRWYPPHRV